MIFVLEGGGFVEEIRMVKEQGKARARQLKDGVGSWYLDTRVAETFVRRLPGDGCD